ncbi:MAG TPA: hypothetical protein VNG90_03055 [Candidatus Acidoferrum sp.]|nr:hypothetical protein [Candidatus Acidoferrum sp.]
MLCQLVFQPVIKLIQVVVSVIEWVVETICQLIQEFVNVLTSVLQYICNTVVQTVCGAVCSVICGICDFFCGIFGCDCGCENVCNNVCNTITSVVCGWTWILTWVLQAITTLVCSYILKAFIALLNIIEAIVTMVLTWICSVIDVFIRWLLCWTYLAEIFNNTDQRRLKVAPKIVPNNQGYSDWFVYVNNPNQDGTVSQSTQGYILSDKGKPLAPVVDPETEAIGYFEVETRGNSILGNFKQQDGQNIPGQPSLYYAHKVLEIASHLLGDAFATHPSDDGTGTDFHKNLLTYNPNVQKLLAKDKTLSNNSYNNWSGKYTNASDANYFGDDSITDMGVRVDVDACNHPTNTFLDLVNGDIEFTPGNSTIAETMSCGAGQTLTFDQTNFLMLNKDNDSSAITTYLVSKYNANDTSVGCNDLLGYTVVTFEGSDQPLFITSKVLPYDADTNQMMAKIVENISGSNQNIVRVAETYIHESGHQCGLLHDSDKPDCENDTTLHVAKTMNPNGSVRRVLTRLQWCMMRTSPYISSGSEKSFTKAPELPDPGND